MSKYKDTPIRELQDWTNPDKLMELWSRIDKHPRISARKLGVSHKRAQELKNLASNYATYLRLEAEGKPERAQVYLDIYKKILWG
jgi:hypothetical protein